MFFLIILVTSVLVRIPRLDFPLSYIFAWGDGARDFFIANHILSFREFPLLGPFNLLYDSGIYNTPLYYYILSFFLIPFNNVLTLGVVNIFFQIGTILIIYLIAKKLFDKKTAILSILIFSFNPEILAQSDYIWQPHLSQTFAYLALLFAVLFHLKNRLIFLISSSLALAFSFAMHNSTFPWIPIFFIFFFRHFFKIFFIFSLFLGILYIPVGVYLLQSEIVRVPFSLFIQNINQYFINFFINFEGILKAFNLDIWWLAVVSILSFVYFLKSKDFRNVKISVLLLLILFIAPLFFASFFNKFRLHYLTLSLGVFTIFISKIFTSFHKFRLITGIMIILFLKSTTADFQFLYFKTPFENLKSIDQITMQILGEVRDAPFQIKSYAMDEKIVEYPVLDTVFLIPLEKKLNKKLAVISDNSPYNHVQTGGKEYFVVACHEFSNLSRWKECLNVFQRSYPNYGILKNLYTGSNMAVYLTKHEN